MKKKISAIILAALMLSSSLIACGAPTASTSSVNDNSITSEQPGSSETPGSSESDRDYINGGTMTDDDEHYVDESLLLHRRTVKESNRPFAVNGETEYAIIIGTSDMRAVSAADFLVKQVAMCTGATIPMYVDGDQDLIIDSEKVENRNLEYTPSTKYLVFAHEALEREANVTWATDANLAYSGYMIKTVGDSVFMKVNSFYGYQTVAQAFLRAVIGYEWYAADTIRYTKDGATLPDMDIVEKPDFDLTWNSGYMNSSDYMASPLTKEGVFTFINGNFCHNSFDFLPVETYYSEHPDWYAHEAAQPINQLCYSAHGNKEEYDIMLNTAFEAVMESLAANPTQAVLTFTRQDGYGHCICENCNKISSVLDDSHAAMYMFFVNDLDTLVQAELQRIADETGEPKRELTILFFAYSQTASAPVFGTDGKYTVPALEVIDNGDGTQSNVIQVDGEIVSLPYNKTYENGLKCNEHVGIFYAPIDAAFEESFYHPENKEYKETFEKWSLLGDRLYCWIYDTNFTQYLVPYNSYDGIPDTIRFLKSIGGEFMFNQGDRQNAVYAGFGAYRTYLTYTLSREVNLHVGELRDKFFENYFDVAAEPMRKYFNSLVSYMEQLQIEYPEVFYTQRRTNSMQMKFWKWSTLQSWLDLCDEAYVAIEKYKITDPDLYEVLHDHITAETIFPRFVIAQFYSGSYTPNEIYDFRAELIKDCNDLGYRYYAEMIEIKPWFDAWGF